MHSPKKFTLGYYLWHIPCCFVVVLCYTVCLCSPLVLSFCFYSGAFASALSSFASTFASETNIYYCLARHANVEESFEESPTQEGIQDVDAAEGVRLNEHLVWIINYEQSKQSWNCTLMLSIYRWCGKMCHSCVMTRCQQCCSAPQMVNIVIIAFCAVLALWINVHRGRPRSMQTWLRQDS